MGCQILRQIKDTPGTDYTEEGIKGEKNNVCYSYANSLVCITATINYRYERLRHNWKTEEEKEDCHDFLKLASRKEIPAMTTIGI